MILDGLASLHFFDVIKQQLNLLFLILEALLFDVQKNLYLVEGYAFLLEYLFFCRIRDVGIYVFVLVSDQLLLNCFLIVGLGEVF